MVDGIFSCLELLNAHYGFRITYIRTTGVSKNYERALTRCTGRVWCGVEFGRHSSEFNTFRINHV